MLLKIIDNGKETPYCIDTAKEKDGTRWVQVWMDSGKHSKCVKAGRSLDEAVDEIEERLFIEQE